MFKNITLLPEEIEIILGGILGDSSLPKDRNGIFFRHSEKQKEYIAWKRNKLISISNSMIHSFTKEGYEYYAFSTKSNKCLNDFYKKLNILCKENGIKKVNRKWLNMLTPLSLAIWWMDDGCLSIHKGNRYGKLCTHNFTYDEHLIIQKYFKTVWDIDIQIKMEKNKYYFCRFNVKALIKLINIIYPFVSQIPSMIYKIDMKYKNSPPKDLKFIG